MECAQKSDNIRVYDNKHACYYCGALSSKIARHYSFKDRNECDVKVADEFPIDSKERKCHLEKLRLLGNYHHNMSVLETGEGDLIVIRRPSPGEACMQMTFYHVSIVLGSLDGMIFGNMLHPANLSQHINRQLSTKKYR